MRRGRPAPARLLAALLLSALLGLTACGGQEIRADEVPGPPADLPVPGDPDAATAPAGDATTTPTPTPTPTPATAPEDGASTPPAESDTAAAPESTTGGTPATGTDAPETDEAPPAGSEAERFEEFCEANPGAC